VIFCSTISQDNVPRPGDKRRYLCGLRVNQPLRPVQPLKLKRYPVKHIAQGHTKQTCGFSWSPHYSILLMLKTYCFKYFGLTRQGNRTLVYRLRSRRSNH